MPCELGRELHALLGEHCGGSRFVQPLRWATRRELMERDPPLPPRELATHCGGVYARMGHSTCAEQTHDLVRFLASVWGRKEQ